MAICKQCGTDFGLWSAALGTGLCASCHRANNSPQPAPPEPEPKPDAASESEVAPSVSSTRIVDVLSTRYKEAYHHAYFAIRVGRLVQVIGIALGLIVLLAGLVVAQKGGSSFGGGSHISGVSVLASLLFGCLTALPIYALGVAVAAQGQIHLATLDSAINGSRHLSDQDVERILRKKSLLE